MTSLLTGPKGHASTPTDAPSSAPVDDGTRLGADGRRHYVDPEDPRRLLERFQAGEVVRALRGIVDVTRGSEVIEGAYGVVQRHDPNSPLVIVQWTGGATFETLANNLEAVHRDPNPGSRGPRVPPVGFASAKEAERYRRQAIEQSPCSSRPAAPEVLGELADTVDALASALEPADEPIVFADACRHPIHVCPFVRLVIGDAVRELRVCQECGMVKPDRGIYPWREPTDEEAALIPQALVSGTQTATAPAFSQEAVKRAARALERQGLLEREPPMSRMSLAAAAAAGYRGLQACACLSKNLSVNFLEREQAAGAFGIPSSSLVGPGPWCLRCGRPKDAPNLAEARDVVDELAFPPPGGAKTIVPEAPPTQPRSVVGELAQAADIVDAASPEDVGELRPQDFLDMAHVLATFGKCVEKTKVASLGGEHETAVRLGELEHMLSETATRARILGRATRALAVLSETADKCADMMEAAEVKTSLPKRPTMTSLLAEHQEKRDTARMKLLELLAQQTPGVARSRRWLSLEVDTNVMRELRSAVRDGLVKARRGSRTFGMAYEITAEGRALLGGGA